MSGIERRESDSENKKQRVVLFVLKFVATIKFCIRRPGRKKK